MYQLLYRLDLEPFVCVDLRRASRIRAELCFSIQDKSFSGQPFWEWMVPRQ